MSEYLKRIKFKSNDIIDYNEDYESSLSVNKIVVKIIDTEEKMLVDTMIQFAEENGYTDLYLIDKDFLQSAILNEIQRRKKEKEKQK